MNGDLPELDSTLSHYIIDCHNVTTGYYELHSSDNLDEIAEWIDIEISSGDDNS